MKNKLSTLLAVPFLALGFASGVSADEHIEDTRNCGDFADDPQALMTFWYENDFSAENDPHDLDGDEDGYPCEIQQSDYNAFVADLEADSEEPATPATGENTEDGVANDRDCDYFATHEEALTFWFTNGYSADNDPHRLDGDGDGIPCEVTQAEFDAFVADWNSDDSPSSDDNTGSDEGEPLPDTATNNPLMILIGAGLAGAGVLLLNFRKKKEINA
ncbi:LPXTG cell wall anchor domain-containing protein [Indiicoccus explosivorum]|uniref:LPXTG cell wall anchor domain-containing protein n=1 Tax=Indiicoccus explosivorum TaxID=1917864 RepID=UPI00138FD5C0|nr:excalibur calcium-binding domain-containing protein [Indiicoccus explosivorum]